LTNNPTESRRGGQSRGRGAAGSGTSNSGTSSSGASSSGTSKSGAAGSGARNGGSGSAGDRKSGMAAVGANGTGGSRSGRERTSGDRASRGRAGTDPAAADQTQVRIVVPDEHSMVGLLGSGDELLRVIENAVNADFHVRGNEITITGSAAETAVAARLFDELVQLVAAGTELTADSIEHSVSMLRRKTGARPAEVLTLDILSSRGRTIRPKTLNQKRYVDAIDVHTVVFAIGPAGTGKTYLAMAKAVKALQDKEVNRIILTRPAVEAGERLGFLPGTLYEKIDPYLRPLYDALHDMVDPDSIPRLTAAGTIEIAPLAYMRGRTLNDSFIILDEAQNTSPEQMKMFLTRLGFGSRIVVTGDITQVDLPSGTASGLRQVQDILDGVEDVYFSRLTSHDVVRHKLVADIVDAYERYDARQAATEPGSLPAGRQRRDGYRGR
jgi:phosphate starvation-inducible protein PhoH and related proteins